MTVAIMGSRSLPLTQTNISSSAHAKLRLTHALRHRCKSNTKHERRQRSLAKLLNTFSWLYPTGCVRPRRTISNMACQPRPRILSRMQERSSACTHLMHEAVGAARSRQKHQHMPLGLHTRRGRALLQPHTRGTSGSADARPPPTRAHVTYLGHYARELYTRATP